MVIHRITASKEAVSILNKAGHSISYNDVCLQNEEWLSSVSDTNQLLGDLQKVVVTHSSLDNNDMRQDTKNKKNRRIRRINLFILPKVNREKKKIQFKTTYNTKINKK